MWGGHSCPPLAWGVETTCVGRTFITDLPLLEAAQFTSLPLALTLGPNSSPNPSDNDSIRIQWDKPAIF